MPTFDYRYELFRGAEGIATGHLTREQPLEVGEQMMIDGRPGVVRLVEPLLGERELRLVAQLWLRRTGRASAVARSGSTDRALSNASAPSCGVRSLHLHWFWLLVALADEAFANVG